MTAFILCCALPAHAACVDPVGDPGDILYNEDERVFQGCLSTGWVALQVPGEDARLSDGLVGHWPLNGDASNLASPTRGGALLGTILWPMGVLKQSALFNGIVNNEIRVVPDDDFYDFGAVQDFSVSAWVKTSNGTKSQVVVSKRGGGSGPG